MEATMRSSSGSWRSAQAASSSLPRQDGDTATTELAACSGMWPIHSSHLENYRRVTNIV